MKKLKKILLINWLYFSKQLIDVEDVNFLTGENGAGKSTFIDALQIVLLGETNTRIFNQAANEKSQRTVDGYLRADMDDANPNSRRGKDFSSYVACEFFDEVEGTQFVSGIVFDCRSDGSRRDNFFSYDGALPENCFLDNQQAMDIPTLRAYLKEHYGLRAKLYDTHKQYRDDMLAKWNIQNEQVFRMLKKAVSFKPIVDIQKFITENICDIPDKPDIDAMQQNIRDYKRDEQLAQRQEDKLNMLKEIEKLYRDWLNATERLKLHRFLVNWAEKEYLAESVQRYEDELRERKSDVEKYEQQCAQIEQRIKDKSRRADELNGDLHSNETFREQERLDSLENALNNESQKLSEGCENTALDIRLDIQRWISSCRQTENWNESEYSSKLLSLLPELTESVTPFENCGDEIFSKPISLFEKAQRAISAFADSKRECMFQIKASLTDLRDDEMQKRNILNDLKRNVKDYPKGLLPLKQYLSDELCNQLHKPVSIEVLADVLEIADGEEQWRGAVEGYLHTQKFYLLVSPDTYHQALQLYNRVKHNYGERSFGLVDIGKLREKEKNITVWDDSLAKKVKTNNNLARTYIDYLLGRVVCCAHVSQLRNHRTSLTSEGMLYQGYVARPIPKERMNDTFIGHKAVALRIRQTEKELARLTEDIREIKMLLNAINGLGNDDTVFAGHYVQNVILHRQQDYLRILEIKKELEDVKERRSHLDLLWVTEMEQTIKSLRSEVESLGKDRDKVIADSASCKTQIQYIENEKLPEYYRKEQDKKDFISDFFTDDYINSVGIPRYSQELKRLKRNRAIADNYGQHMPQSQKEEQDSLKELFRKRREYVGRFQPCSFDAEAVDNDEFAGELHELEESVLPKYREKIQHARESAMEQFQNDFLAKLKSSIDQVEEQVKNLNRTLKNGQFGTDKYQFRVGKNPDYAEYYDMIMDPDLMEGEGGLFAIPFQQKYGKLIEELFSRIATSDDTQMNARKQSELEENIRRYTDFRTYLKFDMETTDKNGSKQLLSETLNKKSGGETQTPFYIAVLASFAQLYQVNNPSGAANNTVRLVVFDEAFNKMDSSRIKESVNLLRKMKLQAIICTPPDKIADIAPMADRTLIVTKEQYHMNILPYSKKVTYDELREDDLITVAG